jgi:pyroglutamyl-peptidase
MPSAGPPRILITGFGPFPGAPFNPTQQLVGRLTRLRRPAFADIHRIGHIFDVTYAAVDRDLPGLIAGHRPDALLMFGLAARTPFVRVETRARNAVSMLWPDAGGTLVRRGFIDPGEQARLFGPHTARLLQAGRRTGLDVRTSRDAGRYLCNYLSWRAIAATRQSDGPRVAAFIHVPLIAADPASRRMTADQLAVVGEAILRETIRLVRQRRHDDAAAPEERR